MSEPNVFVHIDTLPAGSTGAAESSTEDGSYGAAPRPRARRRDHARQHQPTVRYTPWYK